MNNISNYFTKIYVIFVDVEHSPAYTSTYAFHLQLSCSLVARGTCLS